MDRRTFNPLGAAASWTRKLPCVVLLSAAVALIACDSSKREIAVIPRTSATLLSEAEHSGIAHAAKEAGLSYYWNAPMRDDDVQAQLDLLAKVRHRPIKGLILSPDETLPFRTPVQEILQQGIPTIVLGTDLKLPISDHIGYVLNDEDAGARMAVEYLGHLLQGRGAIAITGIRPQLTTMSERVQAFEAALHKEYPNISVIYRGVAAATFSEEQLSAESLLRSHPEIQGIVALTDAATRGAFLALQDAGVKDKVHLIGFDQDLIVPLSTGGIDAIVMQDANTMGRDAIRLLSAIMHGETKTNRLLVSPVLVTKENYKSDRVREILDQRWYAQ